MTGIDRIEKSKDSKLKKVKINKFLQRIANTLRPLEQYKRGDNVEVSKEDLNGMSKKELIKQCEKVGVGKKGSKEVVFCQPDFFEVSDNLIPYLCRTLSPG